MIDPRRMSSVGTTRNVGWGVEKQDSMIAKENGSRDAELWEHGNPSPNPHRSHRLQHLISGRSYSPGSRVAGFSQIQKPPLRECIGLGADSVKT